MTDPTLVVVAGPIAAGKTTVAHALATELREQGVAVVLVGLDDVAEMSQPIDWPAAHRIFVEVVGGWLRSGATTVIAEGPGSPEEVAGLLATAPPGTRVVVCALDLPSSVAQARAAADPTRGVSRDPDFLSSEFRRWASERSRIRADLWIDVGALSVDEAVRSIRALFD